MGRLANNVKNRRQSNPPKKKIKRKKNLPVVSKPICMERATLLHKRVMGVNFFIHLGEWFLFFLFYSLGRFIYFPTLLFNDKGG